jgi:upstream activation factor subunit UAF30
VRDSWARTIEATLIQHPAPARSVEVATQQAVQAAVQKGPNKPGAKARRRRREAREAEGPGRRRVLTERLAKLIHEKAPKTFGKPWYWQLAKQLRGAPEHARPRRRGARVGLEGERVRVGYSRRPAGRGREARRARSHAAHVPHGLRDRAVHARARAEALRHQRAGDPRADPRGAQAGARRGEEPSPELAAIVGDKAMARTEITSKLWGYIKKNNLQDKTNRRMINVDVKLGAIAAKARQKVGKQFSMFEMTKIVQKNIS